MKIYLKDSKEDGLIEFFIDESLPNADDKQDVAKAIIYANIKSIIDCDRGYKRKDGVERRIVNLGLQQPEKGDIVFYEFPDKFAETTEWFLNGLENSINKKLGLGKYCK